jgi:hypothetical protein
LITITSNKREEEYRQPDNTPEKERTGKEVEMRYSFDLYISSDSCNGRIDS